MIDDNSGKTVNIICACSLLHRQFERDERPDNEFGKKDVALGIRRLGITAAGSTVDLTNFDLGAVVKIKGFIHVYRDEKQVLLEKMSTLLIIFKGLLRHYAIVSVANGEDF